MAIQFERVTYRYEGADTRLALALDALELELSEGRFNVLLGEPGSGKSTLLQHMNGLLRPESGAMQVLDERLEAERPEALKTERRSRWFRRRPPKVKQPSGLRRKVGLVFQFPEQQLFEATVLQDFMFGPLNFGASEAEAEKAARRAAADMGIDEALLHRSPFELSSGQMRKAAIAAVLAANPDVLVLDEPTASLDQASRTELLQLLHDLCRNQGKTIVLVTHRLEEVLPFGDRYAVLKAGKAVFQGNAASLLRQPETMVAAGVRPPQAVRLIEGAAKRIGVEIPAPYLDPDSAAMWIRQSLSMERFRGR